MEIVTNSDGWVALEHYNSNPSTVQIESNGHGYTFVPQHNVSLAWVRPEDVPQVMAILVKMCCNKHQPRFHYASQTNVKIWMTGSQ